MIKISKSFILISILILLLIFIYSIKKMNITHESFENENLSYYRCKDKLLGKITQDIFNKNKIYQSQDNWNIYIPCGYNNVENELKKILIKSEMKNKFIFGLNGCDSIVSKNQIWESLVKCYGRDYSSKLMPESYILNDVNEMTIFKKNSIVFQMRYIY